MSGATVRKDHGVLGSILQLAVREKRIPSNPSDGVNLQALNERGRRYLTAQQVSDLADAAGNHRLVVLVLRVLRTSLVGDGRSARGERQADAPAPRHLAGCRRSRRREALLEQPEESRAPLSAHPALSRRRARRPPSWSRFRRPRLHLPDRRRTSEQECAATSPMLHSGSLAATSSSTTYNGSTAGPPTGRCRLRTTLPPPGMGRDPQSPLNRD